MVGMPNPMASQAAWSALAHNKWCDKILAKVGQQYASIFPLLLALCFMLLVTCHASNYASIIGLGLRDI